MKGHPPMLDRQRGALLGLAIGDALGAAVEFKSPGTFPPVTTYRGGGPHGLNAGEWTDDTSMALALADSIATVGWDLNDQAERYFQWSDSGKYSVNGRCFDIGIQTSGALSRFAASRDAWTSASRSSEHSGNGSIMRLAPVPIRYAGLFESNLPEFARLCGESSIPTHASDRCIAACRYLGIVLAGLIHGIDRDIVLSPTWDKLEQLRILEPWCNHVDAVASGSFRKKSPPAIVGSGYVISSLEAALWAFHNAPDFPTAVLQAVNLGDDADTTGAICGQLAGAYFGESAIPSEWITGLARKDVIEAALERLLPA